MVTTKRSIEAESHYDSTLGNVGTMKEITVPAEDEEISVYHNVSLAANPYEVPSQPWTEHLLTCFSFQKHQLYPNIYLYILFV